MPPATGWTPPTGPAPRAAAAARAPIVQFCDAPAQRPAGREGRLVDFYIAGESYGGIYVPTLSILAMEHRFPPNFKGFAIGNGLLDIKLLSSSVVQYMYHHGLVDGPLWGNLLAECCENVTDLRRCDFVKRQKDSVGCHKAVEAVNHHLTGSHLNPYNIYDQCPSSSSNQTSPLLNGPCAGAAGLDGCR